MLRSEASFAVLIWVIIMATLLRTPIITTLKPLKEP